MGRELDPDVRAVAAVALGGALGTSARYGISQLVDITAGSFPWGTFWTNVSGAFLLGAVLSLFLPRRRISPYVRLCLTTGFLGAYTTYSTFAVETVLLIRNGHTTIAVVYAAASLVTGLAAVGSGMYLGRVWRPG